MAEPMDDAVASGEASNVPAEEMPFTEEELQTCYKILGTLAGNTALLEQSNMRDFRKKLAPVSEFMESRKFGGKGRKKYLEDKQLKEEKRARVNKRKLLDKKHVNSSKLRRERIEKLNSLMAQGSEDQSLPLIADGAAESTPMAIENDVQETPKLQSFRSCYTCKTRFDALHHFYDQLCPTCAALNYTKRFQSSDLHGKVALITGARVKIGFQAAIKLLQAGAAVIVTTRFPADAAERFAAHADYATFQDRLQIYGIDFRDLVHLEQFLDYVLHNYSRLDMVVHNACQTVRRPPKYYEHLVKKEGLALEQRDAGIQKMLQHQQQFQAHVSSIAIEGGEQKDHGGSVTSAMKSQVPMLTTDGEGEEHFPEGMVDVNGQQLDLRSQNSWLLKLGQVATPEVAEVFAINTLAPFIMNNKLVHLMAKDVQVHKFIVNVSAMEGKFYRHKTANHPHTNMAKASLNMMTRTCAEDLAKQNIYMTSVDTGWINDENPLEKAHAHAERANFQTPIDEVDAAARVLDPIFDGYNSGKPVCGVFLKDYHVTEW